jgi:anaerobic magnesium-protoporphyrin IX monomethyl ester cyclase
MNTTQLASKRSGHTKDKKEFRVLIVYPNLPLMLIPSIAIGLFTRILKAQGYVVDLFETTHYLAEENSSSENRAQYLNVREFNITEDLGITIKTDLIGDFRRKVEEFKPDFMIYSVVEDAFLQTVALLRQIEDLNIPHLVGGVFPTYAPDRCLEFPEINMVSLGEGERSIVEVAEALRLNKPLNNIAGTWYQDRDEKIHKNPKDPLVDINEFYPDFSLFEESRFYRPMGGRVFKMMPIESYRGCPYACTFCNSPAQRTFAKENNLGNFLRRKTMKNLRIELDEYVRLYNPTFIYFVDDSFLARPREEIFEFCDMYEDIGLPFWFNTRSENCDAEKLARLKEVGCYRISFGIECGNEEYRQKVLKRKITNSELIERFNVIADSGIAFSINLIIGMPGETRELIMDTVKLIRSIHGFDALTVSTFTPYHGTVLREVAIKNGWLEPSIIPKHTTSRSVLNMPPPYLNADEIEGLMKTVPLYCYFPETEWENLRRAEINDEEGIKIYDHYADDYKKNFLGETQDSDKVMIVEGATGCKTNPKDAFRISPKRLTDEEVSMLMMAS